MCDCKDIDFGDCSNMVIMRDWNGIKFQVDKCIAEEVLWLRNMGVNTIASCCGHNKIQPTIAVDEKDIEKMKEFGYKEFFNTHQPNAHNFFIAKSVD